MTLPIVLTVAGCIALLVGLFGGGMKAKEIEVPKISIVPRIFSSAIGIALIWTGISLPPSNLSPTPNAPNVTEIPTAIPSRFETLPPQPAVQTATPDAPNSAPPTSTSIPPTLTPIIPTVTPLPPSPVGFWRITANGYPGTLNIIISNGVISGTIYSNSIEGAWDENTQEVTFKRTNSPDPTIFQIYTGIQIKQGDQYILKGTFEDRDANGNIGTYDWSAER